ncbi:MAG: orotidine-5'-phosphate decarboxylase [Phototrophicaceae bacterium]
MQAIEKYEARARAINSLVCVGLDSDHERLPLEFRRQALPQYAFNRWIIRETHAFASAYKINTAFYEARGDRGMNEMHLTVDYIREKHPDILTICDAKRADIGSTNTGYVTAIFDHMGFDAVTLHPYLGREALAPFLERADRACIILCRTSNPGAAELQDLLIAGEPLWQIVAEQVRDNWNTKGNCMLVAGATYPDELAQIRALVGDMTLLVPGVGAQGASVEATVKAGLNRHGLGMIINASRSVIWAETPAEAAEMLRDEINQYR